MQAPPSSKRASARRTQGKPPAQDARSDRGARRGAGARVASMGRMPRWRRAAMSHFPARFWPAARALHDSVANTSTMILHHIPLHRSHLKRKHRLASLGRPGPGASRAGARPCRGGAAAERLGAKGARGFGTARRAPPLPDLSLGRAPCVAGGAAPRAAFVGFWSAGCLRTPMRAWLLQQYS